MVRVSIDVGALRGVVSTINTFASTAETQQSTVSSAAALAVTSAPSLSAVAAQVTQAKDAATALGDRVDLAILVNGGDEDFNGTVSYDIPYDTASSTRRMIGEQLAVLFADLPDGAGPEELARLHDLAAILGRHSDDDFVLGTMFDDLGPEGTLSVAQRLNQVYEDWDEGGMRNPNWPDAPDGSDQHITEYLRDLQQSFMSTFGNALATATNGSYLDDDYGTKLAQYATENRGMASWALSQTLRFGTYEAGFLTDIGDHLYEFEREEGEYGPVWGPMMGDDRPLLGTSTEDGFYDPFVGLFSAMGRTPEAALDFFAGTDENNVMHDDRISYFAEDRTMNPDGGNTLFEALDAATTTYRDPDDPYMSSRAAWLMSQTVEELANRDGDPAIPDAGKDSLGHMFATYITDVDAVAQGQDRDATWYDVQATDPWLDRPAPGRGLLGRRPERRAQRGAHRRRRRRAGRQRRPGVERLPALDGRRRLRRRRRRGGALGAVQQLLAQRVRPRQPRGRHRGRGEGRRRPGQEVHLARRRRRGPDPHRRHLHQLPGRPGAQPGQGLRRGRPSPATSTA